MLGVPFLFLEEASLSALSAFLGLASLHAWIWFHQKHGTDVHLKWHLSLLSFRFTCLHIYSTIHSVLSWSLPSASHNTTKMSSTMPNTLGTSLNISSIFHWYISTTGLLQMVTFCICICEIGMQILPGMMIFSSSWGCDNQNSHL